jgi:hypothetical protein
MATGYGRTVLCVDALRTGRYARGQYALAQSLYHRITTPRGSLEEPSAAAQSYGDDIADAIGSDAAPDLGAVLAQRVRASFLKDDRVLDVGVRATVAALEGEAGLAEISLDVEVTPRDASGNFAFTLGVSEAKGVVLKAVRGLA